MCGQRNTQRNWTPHTASKQEDAKQEQPTGVSTKWLPPGAVARSVERLCHTHIRTTSRRTCSHHPPSLTSTAANSFPGAGVANAEPNALTFDSLQPLSLGFFLFVFSTSSSKILNTSYLKANPGEGKFQMYLESGELIVLTKRRKWKAFPWAPLKHSRTTFYWTLNEPSATYRERMSEHGRYGGWVFGSL